MGGGIRVHRQTSLSRVLRVELNGKTLVSIYIQFNKDRIDMEER